MTPNIMPIQLVKIGSLAIVAAPAEVTTMAGRRFREAVKAELRSLGVKHAVISALANSYGSYLATKEEYAMQWYEGAATLFGPNEEQAFRQEYVRLARAMVQGTEVPSGPRPEDVTQGAVDLTNKVALDDKPFGKKFGDVILHPNPSYRQGELVTTQFWGAHPNNNFRTQDSFLVVEVERNGVWTPYTDDGDPATTFRWARDSIAYSKVTITWETDGIPPGRYRIRYKGDAKTAFQGIKPIEGVSAPFEIETP